MVDQCRTGCGMVKTSVIACQYWLDSLQNAKAVQPYVSLGMVPSDCLGLCGSCAFGGLTCFKCDSSVAAFIRCACVNVLSSTMLIRYRSSLWLVVMGI